VFARKPGGKTPLTDLQKHDLNHAWDYAVSLLARRDYASVELKKKLAERGYSEHAFEVVVDDMVSMNMVNDERFGQNMVAFRARRGHGPARIRNQLQKSGLNRSAIDEAVKGEEAPDERRGLLSPVNARSITSAPPSSTRCPGTASSSGSAHPPGGC
jgi:SOS response regulatory protein OraA/RecX